MEKIKYLKYPYIPRKIDLNGQSISIRNRYTYFPLYDVDKNSYIRRYRLWVKYREKCKAEKRPFVDCKMYSKILAEINDSIQEELITNPDGVQFKNFSLQVVIQDRFLPTLYLKSKIKKKNTFNVKSWLIIAHKSLRTKINIKMKQKKLLDFSKSKFILRRYSTATKFDLFDDFL